MAEPVGLLTAEEIREMREDVADFREAAFQACCGRPGTPWMPTRIVTTLEALMEAHNEQEERLQLVCQRYQAQVKRLAVERDAFLKALTEAHERSSTPVWIQIPGGCVRYDPGDGWRFVNVSDQNT